MFWLFVISLVKISLSSSAKLSCRDIHVIVAYTSQWINPGSNISTFLSNYLIVSLMSTSGPHVSLYNTQSSTSYFEIVFDWEYNSDHRYVLRQHCPTCGNFEILHKINK